MSLLLKTSLVIQNKMRIAKFIANAGFCSRREAEKLIQDGMVKINDCQCYHPSATVNINDKNEYFINGGSTPIISTNIKSEILKNLGRDSVISLYGSNESSWEASVYIVDIAKQNNIKISLNGNKK